MRTTVIPVATGQREAVHDITAECAKFAREAGGDAALGVREGLDVEHPGEALAALDLAEQDVATGAGQAERERGRDRRLPRATLPGDDVQAHLREVAARHPPKTSRGSVVAGSRPGSAAGLG